MVTGLGILVLLPRRSPPLLAPRIQSGGKQGCLPYGFGRRPASVMRREAPMASVPTRLPSMSWSPIKARPGSITPVW